MTGIRDGSLPDRILDVLQTDGGWMTTSAIHAFGLGSHEAVQRALFRLRNLYEVIESRPLLRNEIQPENEWRAL